LTHASLLPSFFFVSIIKKWKKEHLHLKKRDLLLQQQHRTIREKLICIAFFYTCIACVFLSLLLYIFIVRLHAFLPFFLLYS
jgi:hypothetical protein